MPVHKETRRSGAYSQNTISGYKGVVVLYLVVYMYFYIFKLCSCYAIIGGVESVTFHKYAHVIDRGERYRLTFDLFQRFKLAVWKVPVIRIIEIIKKNLK